MTESDLDRYKRDEERFFKDLEDEQRARERLISERELIDRLEHAGIRWEHAGRARASLVRLALAYKMSPADAEQWAASALAEAVRRRLAGDF